VVDVGATHSPHRPMRACVVVTPPPACAYRSINGARESNQDGVTLLRSNAGSVQRGSRRYVTRLLRVRSAGGAAGVVIAEKRNAEQNGVKAAFETKNGVRSANAAKRGSSER